MRKALSKMYKVLYVEDDINSRRVMKMSERIHLGQLAITIFEDSTDFEMKLAQINPNPDIILLDIHVTPYTGFEMLQMIRANSQYDSIPIIACTASVMDEEIDMLKDVGFQGVISKPLDLDNLPNLFQRILNGEVIWHIS